MYKFTTAMVAAVLVAGTALAGEAPDFTKLDKDKNGYVSKDEARAAPEIMELFASVDVNRDNQLSTSEYMEAVKQLQG